MRRKLKKNCEIIPLIVKKSRHCTHKLTVHCLIHQKICLGQLDGRMVDSWMQKREFCWSESRPTSTPYLQMVRLKFNEN
jgi:hypothetical protein